MGQGTAHIKRAESELSEGVTERPQRAFAAKNDTLASLNLAYPEVAPDKLKEVAAAKQALLGKE